MNDDRELCVETGPDSTYTCKVTGRYCPKVSEHMRAWEQSVAYCADNKLNNVIYTGESNLCVDVDCNLYRRVRKLNQKTK